MVSTTEIAVKVDELVEKDADTVDSDIRYMAYAARLRTALRASTRYVAYVRSDLIVLVQVKQVLG
jgi:fission process protein 1